MSKTSERVVIVGAGHAGGSAAALLRQYGWQGPITLIGAEGVAPYQRPPLSKTWLKGEQKLADLLLRPTAFYSANRIDLRLDCAVTEINRADACVVLSNGERVQYDHLVLATGCHARALPVSGHRLGGVAALRTLADADRLRPLLHAEARLAIVGAGYIGLEVAASARSLGVSVVVVEREARVLPRVASEPLSGFFRERHAKAGVRIITDATVEAFEGNGDRVAALRLSNGEVIDCDAVLVGIGAAPNQALAQAAGLACDDGIHVDLAARTADPAIHAIGDCTRRPVPLYQRTCRLESVPNALEQAKQAAAELCGRAPPTPEVPWFWSDQYDVRLQIAGLSFGVSETVVRGDPGAGAFATFLLGPECTVQAVEAVNAPAEFMAGRMMIARRKRVVASRLADVSCSIRELAG
jgi:3-phenylpropionate/trans-cinnamate dioxygenase ferredoxin reductase subunit